MLKQLCVIGALQGVASVAFAGEALVAGEREFGTNHVEAGQTDVQSGRIAATSGGIAYKTGEGTWKVSANVLEGTLRNKVVVKDGELAIDAEDTPVAHPVPDFIDKKAVLWLDASSADSLKGDGASVSTWYDVRETDFGSPTRMYANAFTDNKYGDKTPFAKPEQKAFGGKTMVWFGGYTSDRSMTWRNPDGSRVAIGEYDRPFSNLFIVHAVESSYGFLLGYALSDALSMESRSDFSIANIDASAGIGPYCRHSSTALHGVNILENGVAIDAPTVKPPKGTSLLEVEQNSLSFRVNCFFNSMGFLGENGYWCSHRGGGDYIAEAIAFTNRLTTSERVAVEDYLMAKWGIARSTEKSEVALSGSASASLEADGILETPVEFTGTGTLVKKGTGTMLNYGKAPGLDSVALDVAEGNALLTRQKVLAPIAGSTLQAVLTSGDGPDVSVAADQSADTLRKTGDAMAFVDRIPEGVSKLKVAAGSLTLQPRAVATVDDVAPIEVIVPNGSFEDGWTPKPDTGYASFQEAGGTLGGWTMKAGTGSPSGLYLYNRTIGIPPSIYSEYAALAPDGDCYCCLHKDNGISTEVEIPVAGTYVVSWQQATRGSVYYGGLQLEVSLAAADGSRTYDVGRSISYAKTLFAREAKTVVIDVPGRYRLNFASRRSEDSAVLLDDIHIRHVEADVSGTWKIPGGDFDCVDYASNSDAKKCTQSPVAGWTFANPDGWSQTYAACGVVTPCYDIDMQSAWFDGEAKPRWFNGTRLPEGGDVQLLFLTNGTTATATFTPPAGRWRLQAYLGAGADAEGDLSKGNLAATVTVGGTPVALGNVGSKASSKMAAFRWPEAFEANGSDSVTLTLAYTQTGGAKAVFLHADDFVLVPAAEDDGELVKNGNFEAGNDRPDADNWEFVVGETRTGGKEGAKTARGLYNGGEPHFGPAVFDGSWFLILGDTSAAQQTIHFPAGGRYRLSFYTKSRYEPDFPDWANYPDGWMSAKLSDGVSTWALGPVVKCVTTNWVESVFDFEVPSACDRTLILQGVRNADRGGEDRVACVEGVSIRAVRDAEVMSLPENLAITMGAGTTLNLSYSGTNTIERLKVNGVSYKGVVDANVLPGVIFGSGALNVVPNPTGMMILLR